MISSKSSLPKSSQPERLGDLLVVELDPVGAVDADHRRQLGDRHALLAAHHVGDHVADLVVHQRDAGHVRRRPVRDELGHACTSLGASRPMSPSKRLQPCARALEGVLEADDLVGQLRPDRLHRAPRRDRARHVVAQPALHDRLVGGAVGLVVGEHPEQHARRALVARGVGLAGADDRRGHEVAVRRRDLHHEARAEQLADQRLEHDRRREQLLGPVADAGQLLDQLARRLPGRVLLPGLLVDRPVEPVDLVREREVVEDQVLREAQLVRGADGHRVVDHVRRRVALGGRVDVHADAVLDVRPREHVPLEHACTQARLNCEKAPASRPCSMFCEIWRTTFALLR